MTEKHIEKIQDTGNKNLPETKVEQSLEQPVPGETTEIKNAHASGLGSMGRHDEEAGATEGVLQKD